MPANGHPPLVDIVMLVSFNPSWADLAIRAVEHHTKTPYRLIIVDQASQAPGMKEVLAGAKARGHTVIHNAENRSFSNGNNIGVRAGSSKFVCILNDDAMVTEGWDSAMIQDASEKGVGLVGCRSNYIGGVQQIGFNWPGGEPPYLCFVCVMLRREIWDVVGPLDEENFTGVSTEDIDYSWRVQKAGYKLKIANAFVLHAGSRSIAKMIAGDSKDAAAVQAGIRAHNAKYEAVLIDKWGKDFVKEHSTLQQKGLVVTYHAEEWTRVEFMKNMLGLRRSDNVGFEYLQISRAPIHLARQLACDFAVDNGFEWMVQLDDDATFPPDVLRRLLSHQKDVVCALAYQRKPPHSPCIFELGDTGLLGAPMEGIEHTGLRRVDVSGYHCSVIRTSVIKRLREGTKNPDGSVAVPGTRQYFGGFDNKLGEDFAFSINLKKIGIKIHCDTELISGHIGSATIVDEAYKRAFMAGQIHVAPPR